jgi:hypothetical protein
MVESDTPADGSDRPQIVHFLPLRDEISVKTTQLGLIRAAR